MAVTSLWHIEGRLKDLIAYVENPEKTVANNSSLQPLFDVLSYVSRPTATERGEYVSAINCLKEIALQQMILTKKQMAKRTDISLGTVIRALSRTKSHPKRHTKSVCRPQRKCGEINIKLSLPPTLTKIICTIIFALIRYPLLTEVNTTIQKRNNGNCVMYPTVSVPNTVCRLSKIRTKHRQDRCGLMRKAVSLHGTISTVRMCVKP